MPGPDLTMSMPGPDLAMRPAVDAFAAYVGFVRRAPVVAAADFEIESFTRLEALVLP